MDTQLDLAASLDQFDLLDDELNEFLGELATRSPNVVFVADSCHSGTITRGDGALLTRAVPIDTRPHPLGARTYLQSKASWVAIGAARDKEAAMEYFDKSTRRKQGAFTWFWAKALESAAPSDTWRDVFKRASAMLAYEGYRQQPQFDGDGSRTVLDGVETSGPTRYTVLDVSSDGKTAIIEAGAVLGVSTGCVFLKPGAPAGKGTVTITSVDSTRARGTVIGDVRASDLVVLDKYLPPHKPLRVYLYADLPKDEAQVEALREHIKDLPAVEIVKDQSASDLVLWVLRPGTDASGKDIVATPGDSLPRSSTDAPPQCWMLTPAEKLYNGQERLKFRLDSEGIGHIVDGLSKIARVRGLLDLASAPGQPVGFQVKVRMYVPAPGASTSQGSCAETVELKGSSWKLAGTTTLADMASIARPAGDVVLLFEIENSMRQPYYFYVINITPDGHVLPVPLDSGPLNPFDPINQVKPGENKLFCRGGLQLTEGTEYVRVLASREPVDVRLLEQEFNWHGIRGGGALSTLLGVRAGMAGTRGTSMQAQQVEEWSTMLGEFVAK